MKSLLLLFTALPLIAQEPAAVPEKKEPELPAKAPLSSDDKLLELLRRNPTPEGKREAPKAAKPDAFGLSNRPATASPREKDRTTLLPPVTSTDLDLRIRYRKARNFAEQVPAVVAAWDESRVAKTDYAKREALKRYHELIRTKVLALDPGVAPILNERYAYSMRLLSQTRVEPTDPQGEDAKHNP